MGWRGVALAMAPRLKVFAASLDGLHQWIVAAPSQTQALAAWGVHQNLFQQGEAAVTDDPVAVKAALAAPGRPLRRPTGSSDPFKPAPESGDLDAWQAAAKATGGKAPARKAPDRRALRKAEAALADFDTEADARRGELAEQRAELERRATALERSLAQRRAALVAALAAARKAADH